MYELAIYAFLSALIVSVVSLVGVATLSLSEARMQKTTNLLISLAAGAMLGNALLHLLPHSLEYASTTSQMQIVDQHQQHSDHDAVIVKKDPHGHNHDLDDSGSPVVEQEHQDHDHDHDREVVSPISDKDHGDHHDVAAPAEHEHSHGHPGLGVASRMLAGLLGMLAFDYSLLSYGRSRDSGIKPVGYMVLLSDGLENFLDGLVIGTAYLISVPLGIATTMAVFAHEIPVEMGDFAVLTRSGFNRKKALLLNFLSGLVSVVGVAIALFAGNLVPSFAAYATPIAAGAFLYIAGSALLPQIRENSSPKDKLISFVMILLGVGIMALILLIE